MTDVNCAFCERQGRQPRWRQSGLGHGKQNKPTQQVPCSQTFVGTPPTWTADIGSWCCPDSVQPALRQNIGRQFVSERIPARVSVSWDEAYYQWTQSFDRAHSARSRPASTAAPVLRDQRSACAAALQAPPSESAAASEMPCPVMTVITDQCDISTLSMRLTR